MNYAALPAGKPASGWYPYGVEGRGAEWDSHAWTNRAKADPSVPAPAKYKRRPWLFLTHLWFWMLVAGFLIASASGVMGRSSSSMWWLVPAMFGSGLVVFSFVMILNPRVRFTETPHMGMTFGVGILSGLAAILIAHWIEETIEPALGLPMLGRLWLAGPVEETMKLLVPVLLLVFLSRIFGDPRQGLLMVMTSGAVFGMVEAGIYMHRATDEGSRMAMAFSRPLFEGAHVLWSGAAAAAIWLGAYHSKRLWAKLGVLGWLAGMAMHSLNDGLPDTLFTLVNEQPDNTTPANASVMEAFTGTLQSNVTSAILLILFFLALRYFARDLVPPTAVLTNSPHWRPKFKHLNEETADTKS